MKLGGQPLERFLRQPSPGQPVVLVYGPDQGLVRERVERLLAAVLEDPKDPFRLTELAADTIRADPGRLLDEARALCLVGGRRVVRVRQGDQLATACQALLALGKLDALIVIEAGELGPGSSLRRLVDSAPNAAAIACYRDEGRDLGALIDRLLAEHELRVEPDARTWLMEHLGADRGVTRSELAKLALYLEPGPGDAARAGRVTLQAAALIVGDSAALELDDLAHAAALGEASQLERCLDRLLGKGETPVRVLRALANHLTRLHALALQIEAGAPLEQVIERARPPIHFRRKASVRAELLRWPAARAATALGRLVEAEIGCKTTGSPAVALCRRAALGICLLSRVPVEADA